MSALCRKLSAASSLQYLLSKRTPGGRHCFSNLPDATVYGGPKPQIPAKRHVDQAGIDICLADAGNGELTRKLPKVWTTIHTRTSDYLKLYVLKVFFSNKYITAQVYHTPTRTVAAAACSQEKELRAKMETHSDCGAAAKIGEVLASRLKEKEIPAIHFYYTKEQRYHGKLKALIDGIREHGINFLG